MAPFRQSCSRFAKVSGSSWVSWFAEVVVMTSDPLMKRFMILHLLFDKVQPPGNCLTDRRRPHCDTCTRFAWQIMRSLQCRRASHHQETLLLAERRSGAGSATA